MNAVTTRLLGRGSASLLFALGLLSIATAQNAPAPAPAASTQPSGAPKTATAEEEIVKISPFVVDTTKDKGYMSRNTLSGRGINELLINVPKTIQIANQELMQDFAPADMMSAVEMVSGGVGRRSYNGGDDQFIWGLRVSVSGVMKDGVPFVMNSQGPLYDVDRVEVIKGPSAVLFGQNASAVGGIINYVTRQPTRTPQRSIEVSVGSFNHISGVLHATGPLSDRLGYRLDVGATRSDLNDRRASFYEDHFIGGGIRFDISDRAKLFADFSYGNSDYWRGLTVLDPVTRKMLKSPDDFSINETWAHQPTYQYRGMINLDTELGWGLTTRTYLGYNDTPLDGWIRDQGSTFNLGTDTLNKTAVAVDQARHDTFFGQRYVKKFATGPLNHILTFGGDLRSEVTKNSTFTLGLSNPVFNYRNPVYGATVTTRTAVPTQKEQLRRTEAFAQDEISFWGNRISLIGGIRYHDTMETSGVQLPSFSGSATLAKGDATVGRYGIVYRATPNITLYGSQDEAFRYKSGVDYLGRPRQPSVGTNKEIGVKGTFFGGALGVAFSYFDLTLDRENITIIQGPNDPQPGQPGSIEGGVQTNKGFDFSFSASQGFRMGNLNLVGSLYMGDMKNTAGQKPAGPTNNTASLAASYGFTRTAFQGFKFGAAYVFQGERIGPTFQDGFIPRFDSYETVRAFVGYNTKRFRYQINVDNIFDKEYVDGFEFVTWIYPSAGRTFKFTVAYNF
jgi:iron complex outermembrane recepter protein